jgi:hypothetical protein
MSCNCNQCIDDTIRFIIGTTVNLNIVFEEDISTYTSARFTIRKDYETEPILNKTIAITEEHSINVNLTPADTELFNIFERNKNSAQYIWGLDVIDSNTGAIINVFPQAGNPAPLCISYKHVVIDEE